VPLHHPPSCLLPPLLLLLQMIPPHLSLLLLLLRSSYASYCFSRQQALLHQNHLHPHLQQWMLLCWLPET
jgi:hypothetical protein